MPHQGDIFAESDAYQRFMGRWSEQLAPLLVKWASVGERDSVLDVGSGTGALAFAIVEAFPSAPVTGIDPSPAFVEYARARATSHLVTFIAGDARTLPWPAPAFDKTLALLSLNFVPEPGRAVREMVRVTRARGIVAAAVWDYGGGMEMLRVFWDGTVARDPVLAARDERNMPLCGQGELAELWRASGLEQVEQKPLDIKLTFESFDDYWLPFLGGQGPAGAYAASLPETDRAALAVTLRRRLLGDRQDGAFALQARAWAVKGVVPGP